jgi:hypothetical protein
MQFQINYFRVEKGEVEEFRFETREKRVIYIPEIQISKN